MHSGVEENSMEEAAGTSRRGWRGDRSGGESGRSAEWQKLVADVEDLVKKVANVDDKEVAEIRSKVEHTLAKAKSAADEGIAAVRDRAGEVSDATDDYVRDNPWAAIGIAAAIGIVIGFVAGRR
jgi:ElaB/YqjD/DUF883 family membrane-anchored ribosome-binding protein